MKYIKNYVIVFIIIGTIASCKNGGFSGGKPSLKSNADSVSYAIGILIGNNLKKDGFTDLDKDIVANAINSALKGDSLALKLEMAGKLIQDRSQKNNEALSKKSLEEAEKFMNDNKSKTGVKTTASGLQYIVMKEGSGKVPAPSDSVSVHYKGMLTDGKVFDESYTNNRPLKFKLSEFSAIKGFSEGVKLMNVGSKYKLFLPPSLGYGTQVDPSGPIPPNSVLIFEVEMLSIK